MSDDEAIYDVTWSGAIVPQLAVADRLDRWMYELMPGVDLQVNDVTRERYLDLLVGLAMSASALRALAEGDCDISVEHMVSAIRHLEDVRPGDLIVSANSVWD